MGTVFPWFGFEDLQCDALGDPSEEDVGYKATYLTAGWFGLGFIFFCFNIRRINDE